MKRRSIENAKSIASRLRRQGEARMADAIEDLILEASAPKVPRLDMLTSTEAGQMIGVTGQTIKNWVQAKRLEGYRIGNRIVVPRRAVEEYVRAAGASLDLDEVSDTEAARLVARERRKPVAVA